MCVLDTTVAFYALHDTNPLLVDSNETLILNYAATNIGNAYDTQTGVFTAPVNGLYDFQATITIYVNIVSQVCAGLYVDDCMLAKGAAYISGSVQSTLRAVAHVKKGQKVCLKNALSSEAEYYSCLAEPYTTFSGFLIKAD